MDNFRWPDIVDVEEVHKTISTLKPDNQLFEVRIVGADKRAGNIWSGYFTDCETLINAMQDINIHGKNIYITLNKVKKALYSRVQHDHFERGVSSTSDNDVTRYEWLFVDFDPERPADISSTDEELSKAEELKNEVRAYLASVGFQEPIEAASGNGYHLLYRIDLPINDDNIQLLSDCLTALADMFNNEHVKIDTTNHNPSRICKLHGTKAQKGANTKSRPHRMSRILYVPDKIVPTDKKLLLLLAGTTSEKTGKDRNVDEIQKDFDVRSWLNDHGMTFREEPGRDCSILLLDQCPFNSSHINGDSKVFAYTNGAVAFKCHHNSCKRYKWQDVRLKFEPDAYDHKDDDARIEAAYQKHKLEKAAAPAPKKIKAAPVIRKLKRADSLLKKDIPEPKVLIGLESELPFLVEGTCI